MPPLPPGPDRVNDILQLAGLTKVSNVETILCDPKNG